MHANSRIPRSAQSAIHDQLEALLERHRVAPFRKPYADYNRAAFEASMERRARVAPGAPLILDSCCGVGESSIGLARAYPECYVIGVDQSAARLAKPTRAGEPLPENLDLVRADLVDYWRLLGDAGVRTARHYLLYPNPWPKIGHLARRWHGHPVFPAMLALGGVLECRSNWRIYVDEFCFAVNYLRGCESSPGGPARCEPYLPDAPQSAFERKYRDSGHPLYRTVIEL